jgi:hypothetical protein
VSREREEQGSRSKSEKTLILDYLMIQCYAFSIRIEVFSTPGTGQEAYFFWQQLLLPVAVGIGSTRHRANCERDMHEHDDRQNNWHITPCYMFGPAKVYTA